MTNFEEELQRTGIIAYTNVGGSMLPLLRQGRDVMVIRAPFREYRKNDAVLFKRDDGRYILHRITRVNDDGTYFIIGDHCIVGETVRKEQILGILTEIKRDGKQVSVTSPGSRLYVLSLPLRRTALRLRKPCRRVYKAVRRRLGMGE